jgi:cellobiose-specific phosphotransferase system component IIA
MCVESLGLEETHRLVERTLVYVHAEDLLVEACRVSTVFAKLARGREQENSLSARWIEHLGVRIVANGPPG